MAFYSSLSQLWLSKIKIAKVLNLYMAE